MPGLRIRVRRARLPNRDRRARLLRLDRVRRGGHAAPGPWAPRPAGGAHRRDLVGKDALPRRARTYPNGSGFLAGPAVEPPWGAVYDVFMRILLNDPERARELESAFHAAGCEAERVGALTLVIPPHVPQADAAFFVKAWENRNPTVRIRLVRPRTCPRWRARRRTVRHRCAR